MFLLLAVLTLTILMVIILGIMRLLRLRRHIMAVPHTMAVIHIMEGDIMEVLQFVVSSVSWNVSANVWRMSGAD
jgi:hypothetical protein